MLRTFYKSSEQVPLLFNKFQIQFINEQLQCWITLYHLLVYLTLCRDGQKEVRYAQTAAALFVGGHGSSISDTTTRLQMSASRTYFSIQPPLLITK